MSAGKPTPDELNQLAIQAAEERHTPTIHEIPHSTCAQMIGEIYGKCAGCLEVIDVAAAYDDYRWVFIRCKKCRRQMAYPNPKKREAARMAGPAQPAYKHRREAAGGDNPF